MTSDFCVGDAEFLHNLCGEFRAETGNWSYAAATHDRCNVDSFSPTSFVDDLLHPRHTSDDGETVSTPLVSPSQQLFDEFTRTQNPFVSEHRVSPSFRPPSQ